MPIDRSSGIPGASAPGWAIPGRPPELTIPSIEPTVSLAAYVPQIIPHLALPLIIGPSGAFNVNVQDTVTEVAQCVAVLLGTEEGERTMVPSYGVPDPTFAIANPGEIVQAISTWEPHALATVSLGTVDQYGDQSINVDVALAAGGS